MKKKRVALDETLNKLPPASSWPAALPVTHLTKAREFPAIVTRAQLEPTFDRRFNSDVLYFFYGGVFYRPKNQSIRREESRDNNAQKVTSDRNARELELPVAFVFTPTVLPSLSCYYPFDTGGMFEGKFGDWNKRMAGFNVTYRVNGGDHTIPRRMVYYLYKTNNDYLRGIPRADLVTLPDPLPLLFSFFTDDLSIHNSDHRQCMIECHSDHPLRLSHELAWIGFPDYFTSNFLDLLKLLDPYVPQYWSYPSHVIFNPAEVAAKLELKAFEDVIERYVTPPRSHLS